MYGGILCIRYVVYNILVIKVGGINFINKDKKYNLEMLIFLK